MTCKQKLALCGLVLMLAAPGVVLAQSKDSGEANGAMMGRQMMSGGLYMPRMDAVNGKRLFAAKGCVVCHSVNGVGGTDAPALDVGDMTGPMNPFEFTARMWRGAAPMVMMQEEELGAQIELTGQELADIIAFAHDPEQQAQFSEEDIPPEIRELMEED